MAYENLRRQGFEVFLPLMIKTIKKSSKFSNVSAPLFPGYLFMGTSIDPIPWKSVNGTRGISRAVTLDGVYRSVNARIIDDLKKRCDQQGFLLQWNDIAAADKIKIEKGPFAEFICTVDQIKDDQRAWVLIDVLKQQTRAEVSLNDVSKIN